jgi:ArsR family transcriptional regulator
MEAGIMLTAGVFRALGDPTRLRIVEMLAINGEMCVCKITEELKISQSSASHHLATLRHAGLVHVKRVGQWSHYSLNRKTVSEGVKDFVDDLLVALDAAPTEVSVCPPRDRLDRMPISIAGVQAEVD